MCKCGAGDMLGLGSLTLPSVFARLGWVPALAIIALCAVGTIYSGRLFTLLVQKARFALSDLHSTFVHQKVPVGVSL